MSKLPKGPFIICAQAQKEREISEKSHIINILMETEDEEMDKSQEYYPVMLPKNRSFRDKKTGKLKLEEWLAREKEKEIQKKTGFDNVAIIIAKEEE